MKRPMVFFSLNTLFIGAGAMVGVELGLYFGGTDWWGIFGFLVSMVICTAISFVVIAKVSDRTTFELDWESLPVILPNMVRAKVFTRENAIGIYDCFFYHATPEERERDLSSFAPLPPKKRQWFLEENSNV